MIIRQTTTIVFEYPQDYLQEQEWCKTKEDRWIHKSTDTLGAVYENTISYSIGQPSNSEKSNNCECEPRKEQNFCGKCRYLYRDFKYGLSCYRLMDNEPCKYEERKDEPTISKMEQVDEPQYDFGEYADRLWKIAYERGKREALEQTEPSCDTCKLKDTTEWCKRQEVCRAYQPKTEPQTQRSACDTCQWYNSGIPCGVEPSVCKREVEGEPQTERSE